MTPTNVDRSIIKDAMSAMAEGRADYAEVSIEQAEGDLVAWMRDDFDGFLEVLWAHLEGVDDPDALADGLHISMGDDARWRMTSYAADEYAEIWAAPAATK